MQIYRIDLPKFRTALLLAEHDREVLKTMKEKNTPWQEIFARFGYVDDAQMEERLTKLYAIRAHARGKVHIKRAFLHADEVMKMVAGVKTRDQARLVLRGAMKCGCNPESGHAKLDLTFEDQAKYLGDSWREFERAPDTYTVAPEAKTVSVAAVD